METTTTTGDGGAAASPSSSAGEIAAMKELRQQLEESIDSRRLSQQDLFSSLQALVPNLLSSLDLSLSLISAFNSRPFTPTPNPNPNPNRRPADRSYLRRTRPKYSPDVARDRLSVVRTAVAVCLLELVPFVEIDSDALSRRLDSDQSSATPAEKAALADLGGDRGPVYAVEVALRMIADDSGGVQLDEFSNGKSVVTVRAIDRNKLLKELPESSGSQQSMLPPQTPRPLPEMWMPPMFPQGGASPMVGPRGVPRMMGPMTIPRVMGIGGGPHHRPLMGSVPSMGGTMSPGPPKQRGDVDDLKDIEALVNKKTFKEMQKSKTGEELLDLIHRPTAKETAVAAKFKTKGGSQLKEYCTNLTKEDCRRQTGSYIACEKVHFRRIIAPHTDTNLGDCSFLDTCRHTKTCKYVHYELDQTPDMPPMIMGASNLPPPRPMKSQLAEYCSEVELGEPQWINCDIRNFRMDILGQFGVIMADPPWDIHMELPYGTMADDEMRNLNVPALQTDGLIFLWVTGRAMELGRDCLELWGYKRVEEIIWVKTNQLQRIIRTGRTGHWLNHSKEHCLVGIKGNPDVNRNIDTDVIVAEVRETSRKPDEMYAMLERISPRTRKLELFARMHNTQAGWLSLGNQLQGVRLVDDGLRARFKAAYADVEVQPPSPPRASSAMDPDSTAAQITSTFTGADPKQHANQYMESTTQGGYASSGGKPMTAEVEAAD
ncbi:putative N6-adenosine-methyltransferase MT-A70-like [Iris pallida]|uniref:N6-adenosine-methyltransferase MT-A70-like n=1 Tax=Iris pallida TaxID=29817 RepID=A0AAX6I5K9_IRIPA|nr:putative N6-adenosine-methyltransferase MT-A70-like [Iris pallida]KAJ6847775.1 putative N6-adenosine-methyltransferase MT-A70-like [Iris pallida]